MSAGVKSEKRVCVARIGAAHGVRGEVKLWSFTADPLAVASYGPLESADGAQRFEIEALQPGKGCFIARLAGVQDRSAAERLANLELYVPRQRLPPSEHGEFYYFDLIGLAVEDREGAALGTVVAVQNFGAGDLLEVQPLAGAETVLLPFTETVVPVVDIAAGRLVVKPPTELSEASPRAGESEAEPEQDQTQSPPPLRGRSSTQRPGGG